MDEDDLEYTGDQPIEGPPDFVALVELQKAYWTPNAGELAELEGKGIDRLAWREKLRLHHLRCMHHIFPNALTGNPPPNTLQSWQVLNAQDSPYCPCTAMVWQGETFQPESESPPSKQGTLLNPSLTHAGSLEIYRLDENHRPISIAHVSYDELTAILFAPPKLIRAAKLIYADGRDEIVMVPLLYGLTWSFGSEFDRTGQMTRFVAHLEGTGTGKYGTVGIGIGQQDLFVQDSLIGLGSVAQITFPLDMRDPRFDLKARARGLDPDKLRKEHGG